MVRRVSVNQLLGLTKTATLLEAYNARTLSEGDIPFADTQGVHIYADLKLEMSLAAAEDEESAYRNLQILQVYATAAESAAVPAEIGILEVQGQRLHLLKEAKSNGSVDLESLYDACRIFHRIATREIKRLVGQTEFSIRMAADYGRAFLLKSSGLDESESIVSLGVPANRPAKKLARDVGNSGVPAGHLAFNIASLTDPEADAEWEMIDLREDPFQALAAQQQYLLEAANDVFENRAPGVMTKLARDFSPNPHNPVHQPLRRQGFMMRTDLDGFTARVKTAMNGTDQDAFDLVKDFHVIMQYPAAFKETLPSGIKVILFPWAGDCSNMLLECDDYDLERTYLPNTAAINWHDQGRGAGLDGKTNWRKLLGETKWLVALAGGESSGADHGYILTGNVEAAGRTFHVGAGWGWRRSLDAEQSKGTKAEETVIQKEDFDGLDPNLQKPYRDHPFHPTLFKVASFEALAKANREHRSAVCASSPAIVPSVKSSVPAPRPYLNR